MKTKYWLLLLIIPVGVALYFVLPWLLIYLGMQSLPNPKKPEISYGEFPFRLEYEINGERMVIYDTLICEYDGIGANTGVGKYRKWKSRLASGAEAVILLEVENPVGKLSTANILTQTICYNPGSAAYYMGDIGENQTYKHNFPNASFYEIYDDNRIVRGVIYENELYEKFNIKLISWEPADPITNSFK